MKALVLAGGFPQIALIQELKSRGAEVLLADYNVEPVAKPYADKYYQVSTLDVEAIRNVAARERVDFVITVCTDQALLTVAKVSEDLGLPCYVDYQTALNATNKKYMKETFDACGIPTAKHLVMETLDDERISELRFPLIVKPADCNSSKGVRRCESRLELEQGFAEAVALNRTNTAIVEEFMDGIEISVDAYVEDGKAKVLCISNSEKIADRDRFVIFRAIWPAPISDAIKRKIELVAQQIADAFQIKNSPMLIQLITDGKELNAIEFSARTGGGVKHLLVQRTSGFDVIKAVVDLTLGLKPQVNEVVSEQKYLVNDFIYCKPGTFDHLEGFEELKAEGLMKDYYLFKWKGAKFDSIRSSGDRVAGYTVTANTTEELIEKHKRIRERIRVISNKGEDMLRRDLLTDLYVQDGFIFSESVSALKR